MPSLAPSARPRGPMGASTAHNVAEAQRSSGSSSSSGRKKVFEGVVKVLSNRKASVTVSKPAAGRGHGVPSDKAPEGARARANSKENAQAISDRALVSPAVEDARTSVEVANPPAQRDSRRDGRFYDRKVSHDFLYSSDAKSCSAIQTSPPLNLSVIPEEDRPSLFDVSLIPFTGLSGLDDLGAFGDASTVDTQQEEEEIGTPYEASLTSLRWAKPIAKFHPEPTKSPIKRDKPLAFIQDDDEPNDPNESTTRLRLPSPRRRRISLVQRKSVPASDTLHGTNREAQLAKLFATRPHTTSLLSFTSNTSALDRIRFHPIRVWKTNNSPSNPDALRKACVERQRLISAGIIRPYHHFTIGIDDVYDQETGNKVEFGGRLPMTGPPKPFLFPRTGNLRHVRSEVSMTTEDDFMLCYVDLSYVHKTLFIFDMRLRTARAARAAGGSLVDMSEEDFDEVERLFGKEAAWESDWEVRWTVAGWLLGYACEYVEEEGEEGSE